MLFQLFFKLAVSIVFQADFCTQTEKGCPSLAQAIGQVWATFFDLRAEIG